MMDDPSRLDIPDTSDRFPPPYSVTEKPAFAAPQEAPLALPVVTLWSTAAAPTMVFGAPHGWNDAPPEHRTWLPVEAGHVDPEAPLLKETRIVAALEHPGAGGHPWSLQLRRYAGALAEVVMQNPANWARAKSRWCEVQGSPLHRSVAGRPAVVLRYAYTQEANLFVFYEAWLVHGGGGYHFILTAPAADEPRVWLDWEAMLGSARPAVAPQVRPTAPPPVRPGPPVARYRCAVGTQVPVTLGNVTSQGRSPMIIAGSPSLAAWSLLGLAAARLYGGVRASHLEGQIISVPASGEAVLMDDSILLRLVVAPQVGRTVIRGGPGDRSVDLEIPYRLIRRWGTDPRGVWMDVVGRGALWLQPQDRGELAQWLAHLSQGKTWQPPVPATMQVEVPVAGWYRQDPRFTFGLPDRWIVAPPHALADYGRFFHPSVLRGGVLLDAGESEIQVFIIDNGPIDADPGSTEIESLAAMLAAAADISPLGPILATTIGGEPVALLRGLSWSSEGPADRCYGALAHAGTLYALWYGAVGGTPGDGSYEAWVSHFHTMLATWHWYG